VEIVARAVAVKAAAVSADEREETGARRLLNFGHTLGHAIESEAGPERLRHGEAVGLGMALAARAGERLEASEPGLEERLRAVLARLGLPDDPDPWVRPEVLGRIRIDKKRQGGGIELVLVRRPGDAMCRRVPLADLDHLVAPAAPQRRRAPKTL
jgi:3-dehydroquinate synthetase